VTNAPISRRSFVRGAALAGLGLPVFLQACQGTPAAPPAPTSASATVSSSAPATSVPSTAAPSSAGTPAAPPAVSSGATGTLKLPTYLPFQGPKPDLAGSEQGVEPGYFRFPKDLVKVWKGDPPGDGSDVTAHESFVSGTPPALDQNAHWQDINKRLNANMKISGFPLSDYPVRLATVLAGGDYPDFLWFPLNPPAQIPQMPDLVKSKFQDLTEYLSGDNIKQFTNLGNVPPLSWRNGIFNGGLYALPAGVNPPFSQLLEVRQDLVGEAGLSLPKNADDFKRMLQALTQPSSNRYGLAVSSSNVMGMITGSPFLSMYGAPNNWGVDSAGKFVKDFEVDGYKATLGYLRDLWATGVIHPNAPTYAGNAVQNDFTGGNVVVAQTVLGGMRIGWSQIIGVNPNARIGIMPPFGADGGKGAVHLGNGSFGITFLKKNTPERIKMLLRICDWLAAPFGSEERIPVRWGVPDVDFTFDEQGNPRPTKQGLAEVIISWQYQGPVGQVAYDPVMSEGFARTVNGWEQAAMAVGVADPTIGLYSPTDASQGSVLRQAMYDGVTQIVLGRGALSDFDQLLKDWKAKGGDKMRGEYEQAYATTKIV